jgi:hypothetical protein
MTDTLTKTLLTFRDTIKSISPPWLQTGLAERILYSMAVQCDAFGDALVAGVKQRFPGLYSFDSLVLLGRERRIERGLVEGDAAYAERLTQWLVDHRRRGSGLALLKQLFLHYAPNNFTIDLLYYAGAVHFRMTADGVITRNLIDFHPDTNAAKWARWWLFYNTDRWADVPPTAAELQDLRLVPNAWNAAHCFGTIVLFPLLGELWDWPRGHTWDEPGTWDTSASSGEVRFVDVEPTL